MHIESFDVRVLKQVAPAKARIGVNPFILSLRPIPGSLMEDAVPAEAYRICLIREMQGVFCTA
ncbi:hypothetical protein DRN98_05085 [Methanosarcinales archaeon]|nr:MAG: hypothetical protein DRN98_05085 [Methanosarcinales archaeon]